MTQGNENAAPTTDAVTIEDYSKFLIHSRTEIVYIVRTLMTRRCILTAHFEEGRGIMLTTVIGVDADNGLIYLDVSPDPAVNARASASPHCVFATRQDKVRIQFAANGMQQVPFEQGTAFRIALPQSLLKLQRRDYFRLETPRGKPLLVTLNHAELGRIEATLADISIGGAGIINLPADPRLEVGTLFRNCRIMLPEIGPVMGDMELRNQFDQILRSGARIRRYGFQFVDLPANSQAMVQRYINKLERERRALLPDPD